jgi:hypothetical protein
MISKGSFVRFSGGGLDYLRAQGIPNTQIGLIRILVFEVDEVTKHGFDNEPEAHLKETLLSFKIRTTNKDFIKDRISGWWRLSYLEETHRAAMRIEDETI